jgi:hypothetical protein
MGAFVTVESAEVVRAELEARLQKEKDRVKVPKF